MIIAIDGFVNNPAFVVHEWIKQERKKMIIILAPSKTMDFQSDYIDLSVKKEPVFAENTSILIQIFKSMSIHELKNVLKVKGPIAELSFKRYQNFSMGKINSYLRPAIFAYTGAVYKGLDAGNFNTEDMLYAEKKLRILSGLYGILSPMTMIEAYRCEMGLKLKFEKEKKLSNFWKKYITEEINRLLYASSQNTILNLASAEYMAAIDKKALKGRIKEITFKEIRNGKLKSISAFSKKARGMMARFIIKNRIENYEELKKFNKDDYKYNHTLSKKDELVFTR